MRNTKAFLTYTSMWLRLSLWTMCSFTRSLNSMSTNASKHIGFVFSERSSGLRHATPYAKTTRSPQKLSFSGTTT